jgi:hypothetical protein
MSAAATVAAAPRANFRLPWRIVALPLAALR